MADGQTKTIYIVRRIDNGDAQIFGHCTSLRTANRVAAMYVGADIIPWEAILHDGFWCAPYREIPQSAQDAAEDAAAAAYAEVYNKALALGLTPAEIEVLETHNDE